MIRKKYSCFIYGEGRRDRKFLAKISSLKKFKDHTKRWVFNYGNAYGGSPKTILFKCFREISHRGYDLVLCFIDLDKLKQDFPLDWENQKIKLEKQYQEGIQIIWYKDNAEEEYRKIFKSKNKKFKGKNRLNKLAINNVKLFINSSLWKRILRPIQIQEKRLDRKGH